MLDKIIAIAVSAGEILIETRKKGFETKTKKDAYDFVTSADIKAEDFIISKLKKELIDSFNK